MELGEAADWFATVPLDGWDGTQWVTNVAYGDFHVYDRFITERTFGAKKRIFLQPDNKRLDTSTYKVVRNPAGQVYIVQADNVDISGVETYQSSILLLEAAFTANIVEYTTTTLASGQAGSATLNVVGTSVCDVERFTSDRSDEFDLVTYGIFKITLPGDVTVGTDQELQIDGSLYEVKEVAPELLSTVVRALRRAT